MASNLVGPAVTGPLLWLLTSSPAPLQQQVATLLQKSPVQVRQATLVLVVKWLFGIGLVRAASALLSAVALNNWRWRSDKHKWNWSQEVAVVTGGCSGIGEEIVKALAARGVKVAVLDMAELPGRLQSVVAMYQKCDVTDAEAIAATAQTIRSNLGHPSILVNNAGIGNDHAILEAEPARVKKVIEVNLISHWYTCREFVPDMVKHNKGHIVEIASMSSFTSVGSFADYSAAKVGVLSFSESLREQLRTWYKAPDVHVTNVHPFWVATPLVAKRQSLIEKKAGKMLSPSIVGTAVAEQIFKCAGTQLIIPKSLSFLSTARAWPAWLSDIFKAPSLNSQAELEEDDKLKQH